MSLIKCCLVLDPERRPTIGQVRVSRLSRDLWGGERGRGTNSRNRGGAVSGGAVGLSLLHEGY